MNCRRARQLLIAPGPASRQVREHAAACEECASYRQRLDAVYRALGDHHTPVAPPAGFASRVRGRLHRDEDPIGWAALRLLPATLGLILLLSWLNLRATEPAADEITDPTTAVLTWVLNPSLEEPGVEGPAAGEDG